MAVTNRTSDYCCSQIQKSLDEMLPDIAPSNFPYDGGVLAALKSPANVGNFSIFDPRERESIGRPATGTNCIVELSYEEPFCETVNDTDDANVCDAQTARGDSVSHLSVTVDNYSWLGGQFTQYEFQCLCETPDQRLTKRIAQACDNIMKDIAQRASGIMYSLAGSFSNGAASNNPANYETLSITNPAGYINPAGMTKMFAEHRKQRSKAAPIVLGGLKLEIWDKIRNVGGLNGNHPVIPGDPTMGMQIFTDLDFDNGVQDVAADTLDHAISWAPGAYQLLEWYENTEYMEQFHDHYTFTTIVHKGVRFDFYLRYEECTRTWKYIVQKVWDIFCLDDALYAPCILGNHKLHWLLDCNTMDCDSYEVAPASS